MPPKSPKAAKTQTPTATLPDMALPGDAQAAGPETQAPGKPDVLKLKDLIAQVVEASGGRRKGTREIVEATLAALGHALSQGKNLNLPPLGKAKLARTKTAVGQDDGVILIKLRRDGLEKGPAKKRKKDVTEGVAAAED